MPDTSSPFVGPDRPSNEHPVVPVVPTTSRSPDEETPDDKREMAHGPTCVTGTGMVDPAAGVEHSRQAAPGAHSPIPLEPEKSSSAAARQTTIEGGSHSQPDATFSMLKKDHLNVLPLHLAPIDSFFLADDKPRYPMTSIIRLEFTGQMDQRSFMYALEGAMQRHPLTRAIIRPVKRGLPCWVMDPHIMPVVDWGPIDKPVAYESSEAIDLTREAGLRFWVRVDAEQTVMTLQVHHACTDGTGVYRFLGDLLAMYAAETVAEGEPAPELADVELGLLRHRRARLTDLAKTKSEYVRNGFKQTANLFCRRIRPLAIPRKQRSNGQIQTPFPGVFSVHFGRAEHKQLRSVASSHGATMNDLLMAEMFRTIIRWNEHHTGRQETGLLRIMMPSDLREQQDYAMPATNMTAYTFITRRAVDCHDLSELLKGVREETARIKNDRLGRGFMNTLQLASYGRSLLKFFLGLNRCISTTILSNVGDPSKRFTASFPRRQGRIVAGNLTLEDVTGVPPLRLKSHATLAIFSYLRKLTVSVRCDPYQFTPDDALRFVNMYADGLRSHLES